MSFVLAQANTEREKFADLLQKRKHLNGYWVGKRYAIASDEDLVDSGKWTNDGPKPCEWIGASSI